MCIEERVYHNSPMAKRAAKEILEMVKGDGIKPGVEEVGDTPIVIKEQCASCRGAYTTRREVDRTIVYGADKPVPITYRTVIFRCGFCDEEWFDRLDELFSEAAVREALLRGQIHTIIGLIENKSQ